MYIYDTTTTVDLSYQDQIKVTIDNNSLTIIGSENKRYAAQMIYTKSSSHTSQYFVMLLCALDFKDCFDIGS